MKRYWDLFTSFFTIGALTFGGGYAMLPMLEREVVEKHKWATSEEILDYFAIGQCMPGIIAANVANMVGYRLYGLAGGIAATFGVVTPSLLIILVIASVLENVSHLAVVQHAFGGIRVAVTVLIFSAVTKLFKSSLVDGFTVALFVAALLVTMLADVTPIVIVLAAGLLGVLMHRRRQGGPSK